MSATHEWSAQECRVDNLEEILNNYAADDYEIYSVLPVPNGDHLFAVIARNKLAPPTRVL